MPSLGGPCQRSGGVGDWSGPRKRRGSSDMKLVRRDLAPSQIVTPGVPQGNRSIPQLPVVSNGLSRIEPDHCRLPSWMFCFGISFSVLCPCWANVISFLCRYFIRHSKGMSSEAQQLETAAHNDGNGTPLHSHRHRISKPSAQHFTTPPPLPSTRGRGACDSLDPTLIFCFPPSNHPYLRSCLCKTASPEPGRFTASRLGGLLTPKTDIDLSSSGCIRPTVYPQSMGGSGKVLIP